MNGEYLPNKNSIEILETRKQELLNQIPCAAKCPCRPEISCR